MQDKLLRTFVLTCLSGAITTYQVSAVQSQLLDLQDKLLRTLVLTCLSRTITTYLIRLGPRLPQDKIQKWLSKTVKPILLNLRKGNFGFPEQQVSQPLI